MTTFSTKLPHVLVVGAGPSGLILALSLLENGIPVRIIDKEPIYRVGSKGAGMYPRLQEVYKFLGLWSDIEKQARPGPPLRLYAAPAGTEPVKTWSLTDINEPTPACPLLSLMVLGQDRVEDIIRRHIHDRFGVSVELGTELLKFVQNEECVTAHLRNIVAFQDSAADETVEVKYLVGADGGRSTVRKQSGLSFLGETRQDNWFLYGDIELKGLDKDHWHIWEDALAGGPSLMLCAPHGVDVPYFSLFSALSNVNEADAKAMGTEPARAEKYIRDISGRENIEFGKWVSLAAHRPNIRMADTFQVRRIFVVGDAAHTHSPTGGQGLNSSVQDSFNLAWKLALVLKGLSPRSLLESYTTERLPVIAEMLERTTVLLDKTLGLKTPKADMAPDKVDTHKGWHRGRELYQLGVNYRWSDIVIDERTPKPSVAEGAYGAITGPENSIVRAGDRAPDAPGLVVLTSSEHNVAGTTRLFDVFRTACHTVLLFVPSALTAKRATAPFFDALRRCAAGTVRTVVILSSGSEDVVQLPCADLVVVDKEGHARVGYATAGATGVVAIIVRPDGVVGGIVLGGDGVGQYFRGIFV